MSLLYYATTAWKCNLHLNLAVIAARCKHALIDGIPGYSIEAFLAGAFECLDEIAILFMPNVNFTV